MYIYAAYISFYNVFFFRQSKKGYRMLMIHVSASYERDLIQFTGSDLLLVEFLLRKS